jgi:hypothetical protein
VIAFLAAAARGVLATCAAMLPRRYWPRLDPHLPVTSAAAAASIVTMLAGAAFGITGFLGHLAKVTSLNNSLYLEAAASSDAESMPLPSALSGLSLFTFILLTPQGWISSYLAVTGLVRSIGSQFDDAHGDFILTAGDAIVRRVSTRVRRRGEIDNRRLLEGPNLRDRIVPGVRFGAPHADLVIVAARIKDGWETGTVVLSDRGEFRITDADDRTIDGRLRRVYFLARHQDLEAFRRTVRYEFDAAGITNRAANPRY